MEFWASEVQPGKPSNVELDDHTYLHISQAALGESKGGKGSTERVVIRAHVEKQEVVIGTLVPGNCDQIAFDLIFDKGFKLSHSSTSYNVYFCGYTSESPGEEFSSSDEEEDEDVEEPSEGAVLTKANGKPGTSGKSVQSDVPAGAITTETPSKTATKILAKAGKPVKDSKGNVAPSTGAAAKLDSKKVALKQSAAIGASKAEKKKSTVEAVDESDDEDSENEDESDGEDEDDSDEDMDEMDALSGSPFDFLDEEDEETPNLKKRAKPSIDAAKTPVSGKKQKLSKSGEGVKPGLTGVIFTPGKKPGDQKSVTTPTVKEQKTQGQNAKKTPGKQTSSFNDSKTSKQGTPGVKQSPEKPGQFHCAVCSRNFVAEAAFSQHNIAKHNA